MHLNQGRLESSLTVLPNLGIQYQHFGSVLLMVPAACLISASKSVSWEALSE